MKIAKHLTLARQDSLWDSGESDANYESRQHGIQEDSFVTDGITYQNITDIVAVEKWGLKLINSNTKGWRDKKSVRDKLKILIYTKMGVAVAADAENDTKYALLTSAEQSIALHWFILGKDSWQSALVNDDIYWSLKAAEYREWTMEIKKIRLSCMESLVFRRVLKIEDAKNILQTMNQVTKDTTINIAAGITTDKFLVKSLTKQYVQGIDGTVEDNGEGFTFIGISDYIDSKSGTPFATNGFRNLTCSFRGTHTANSVADELLTIKNGTW